MNLSYWEERHYFEDNDIVIIGAGIVGLSTAIAVKSVKPSLKILVLERSSLPSGASTKNAGFACFGSVTELFADSQYLSREDQIALIKMRWEGLQLLQSNVTTADLAYRSRGGVEVLDPYNELQLSALDKIDTYNELVEEAIGLKNCFSVINQSISSSFYNKTIFNQYEGELNPMKMMSALKHKALNLGISILYGINVKSVGTNQVFLADKVISTNKIAVCTNGLSRSLIPDLELQAVRNQVYLTEPIRNNPLRSCYHFDQGYVYFREIDGRILIGGARNLFSEQESTDLLGQTDNLRKYLQAFVEEKILKAKTSFEYEWSGILGVGESKVPIIEEVMDSVYVGVRLGGMGVAIGSGVGQKLSKWLI